jgi:hypothetical protein
MTITMDDSDRPYAQREMVSKLTEALSYLPVVVLSGLRQAGKSTILIEDPVLSQRAYSTLDDFAIRTAASQNPEAFLAGAATRNAKGVTIDEVQREPGLLTTIKALVDRKRAPGRFLLSGSANLALLANVAESLAGRAIYLTLHPMTRREILRATARPPVLAALMKGGEPPGKPAAGPLQPHEVLTGGLPPVCLQPPAAAPYWFRGYVQTYVERDARQLANITDLVAFHTLVQMTAMRTAQVLNISQLGRDTKMTTTTTARYLDLLETSYLIHRLPPYLKNRSARLIKSPKIYFTDAGLAAHLAGVHSLDGLPADPMQGALLETYVVQNVRAILEAHVPNAHLSFWNEQGRHEVDLVIEAGRKVYAIKIKGASRWQTGDLRGLKAFMERTPQCVAGILASNGQTTVQLEDNIWAIPLGVLLQ